MKHNDELTGMTEMKTILICLGLVSIATLWGNAQHCDKFILSINGQSSDSTISKLQLAQADSLVFNNAACNQLMRVYTFEVYMNEAKFQGNGNKFSREMKVAFRKLQVGDIMYFEKIKTRDRNNPAQMRLISDLSVTVVSNH